MQPTVTLSNRQIAIYLTILVALVAVVTSLFHQFLQADNNLRETRQEVVEEFSQEILAASVATLQDDENETTLPELEKHINGTVFADDEITTHISHDEDADKVTVEVRGWGEYSATETATVEQP